MPVVAAAFDRLRGGVDQREKAQKGSLHERKKRATSGVSPAFALRGVRKQAGEEAFILIVLPQTRTHPVKRRSTKRHPLCPLQPLADDLHD
ncbi:MAG TPA: hypothetical protein VEI25_07105 [Paraburkholderia sp.]|nr:hypothetical protein [Paraburkholderia sp.]